MLLLCAYNRFSLLLLLAVDMGARHTTKGVLGIHYEHCKGNETT